MNTYYYLERKNGKNKLQILPLGTYTGNTFYPTMSIDVFRILIEEVMFQIHDSSGNNYTLESFQDKIGHSFSSNPPLITLNVS